MATRRGDGPVKPRHGTVAKAVSKADRQTQTPPVQTVFGGTLEVVSVKGKCLYNLNNWHDVMTINGYRQQEWNPVETATYRQAIRDGGKDAGIILSIAMAPIALLELGATIFNAEILVAVRTAVLSNNVLTKQFLTSAIQSQLAKSIIRSMAAKGAINILGQFIGMTVSNEVKFDGVGMLADMVTTNGASSVVGGLGEAGFQLNKKGQFELYSQQNSPNVGAAKFIAGYTFGKYSETIKNGIPVGPNAVSGAMVGVFDALQKSVNEMFEQMAEKFEKIDAARTEKTRADYERLKQSQEK